MNNDNGGETPGNGNETVIDLAAMRERLQDKKGGPPPTEPPIRAGNWEIHLHPTKEGADDVILQEKGYLKFGPQFIAIVEGHEDSSQVRMAVGTHLVRFVKMLSSDATHIQGTLDLNS